MGPPDSILPVQATVWSWITSATNTRVRILLIIANDYYNCTLLLEDTDTQLIDSSLDGVGGGLEEA